jgi:hypothetical protein
MYQVSRKMLFLVIYNCWFQVKLHALHVLLHWYVLMILYLLLWFNGLLIHLIILDCGCAFHIVRSNIFIATILIIILA